MDHSIKIALEVAVLAILVPLTFGFGYFSKLMFFFLVDIDLLFVCKIAAAISHSTVFAMPVAILTIVFRSSCNMDSSGNDYQSSGWSTGLLKYRDRFSLLQERPSIFPKETPCLRFFINTGKKRHLKNLG